MKKNKLVKERIDISIQAAKSEEVGFTHEKLRSIVEHTSFALPGISTNTQRKKVITMSILGLTLVGTVTSALLWLQPQQPSLFIEQPTTSAEQNQVGESMLQRTIQYAPVKPQMPSMPSVLNTQTLSISTHHTPTEPQTAPVNSTLSIQTLLASTQSEVNEHTIEHTTTEELSWQQDVTKSIEGITPVTLSGEEAAFLGIRMNDQCDILLENGKHTIVFLRKNPKDVGTSEDSDLGGGVMFRDNTSSQEVPFSPWIVTTAKGATKMTILNEKSINRIENNTAEFDLEVKKDALTAAIIQAKDKEGRTNMMTMEQYARMSRFIAVRVESGCPGFSLVFWYEPSMEFIQQLPSRYQAAVLQEVYGKNSASMIEVPMAQHEEPKPGCRYIDACRSTAGVIIESSVHPNPASNALSLRFLLTEPRVCTFSLHYVNGILAKQLGAATEYSVGENTFTTSVENLENGMYLLSMVTEKNERIVQRVVIEK